MVVVSRHFTPPDSGVLYRASCSLVVNDQELGSGSLYVTKDNVIWGGALVPNGPPQAAIHILYPTISMHAIQREPSPSLLVVVNYDLMLPIMTQLGDGDANEVDEDDEFDPEQITVTQLRFIPQNEADLQGLYTAMCQGQELHPDPEDVEEDDPYMDGEDEDEGLSLAEDEEFEDAEESDVSPEDAAAKLRQMRLENGNKHDEADDVLEDAEIGDE